MAQEPAARSVRKGTKSCIECRHRKVRCVWPSEGAETCQHCLARGRKCEVQVHMMKTSDTVKDTTRARIAYVERDVSSLWAAVHGLEAKLGSLSIDTEPENLNARDAHYRSNSVDSDSDPSDMSPANPPTHLLQLFDNGLLGSHVSGSATPFPYAHTLQKTQGSSALRELMPSREDMLIVTRHAASWLSLYSLLLPLSNVARSGDEMLLQYDMLQNPNADPVAVAALLLSIALLVQVAPYDTANGPAKGIRDAPSFIKAVSDTVERIVILDDALAGTLEGIETTLLFLRLQLGRARIRKMWLVSRRVIALAEMIGLPRASIAIGTHQGSLTGTSDAVQPGTSPLSDGRRTQKAKVWESICALDRITSMMWSLPLATANYPLPKRPMIDIHGQVIPQSFLYSLADIASRVFELDNICSSGRPLPELSNAVAAIDEELRTMADLTPKSWWKVHWSELSVDAPMQYWYQYFTVRTHIQLALAYVDGQQLAFSSFVTCLDASQGLARRYISLHPLLPAGFFANCVVDLQAFTAVTFLLLVSYRVTRGAGSFLQIVDVGLATSLVEQVVRMMESAGDRAERHFARLAAEALRSLSSLLQQPQTSEAQDIALNLPLVGKLHVSRKSYAAKTVPQQPHPGPSHPPQEPWQTGLSDGSALVPPAMPFGSSNLDMMGSLSYSMETAEDYPFLTDEAFETEQWLTWT